MRERGNRANRLAVLVNPRVLMHLSEHRGAWYESEEEIEAGLRRGAEKARLLLWIRSEMGRRLTPREVRCVELHFFDGLSFREVGVKTDTAPSSVCRAVKRALRKLRSAAREEGEASKGVECPK